MKSRTSFFNVTAFKKDVQRFAPAWVLYLVCLLLGVTMILANSDQAHSRASAVADLIPFMSMVNITYAFINAQLLFGDLYNSRLCNALHAMPPRRECWYFTHTVAGLSFSILPNLAGALIGLLLANIGIGWPVAFYWFAATSLQYLCFFGIAVFCMMLCGNRFAALLVYGIVNFFSLLLYWVVDSVYEPLLEGIRLSEDPFMWLCPVVQLTDNHYLVEVLSQLILDEFGNFNHYNITGIALGNWWPLICYALFGAALLGLGLLMYRKRNLESAGDFAAFKFTEPVLLVLYSLTAGSFCYLFSNIFGMGISYLFLIVGLAVGFFTGLMLLQRTTRVFRPRAFLNFGILITVCVLSLVVTKADPLGLTTWVPKAEEVASVNFSTRYDLGVHSQHEIDLTDAEDIQTMIDVHSDAIFKNNAEGLISTPDDPIYYVDFCIEYTMKDGSVRTRFYDVPIKSEPGQQLLPYFSSLEYLLGITEEEIPQMAAKIEYVQSNGIRDNTLDTHEFMAQIDTEAMLRAIAADCAAGNMAQEYSYYRDYPDDRSWYETYLEFRLRLDDKDPSRIEWYDLQISRNATNTLQWMEENGLYDPEAKPIG